MKSMVKKNLLAQGSSNIDRCRVAYAGGLQANRELPCDEAAGKVGESRMEYLGWNSLIVLWLEYVESALCSHVLLTAVVTVAAVATG